MRRTPRDPRAERIPGPVGTERSQTPRRVLVAGGGIAGLAAATGLAERGVAVDLVDPAERLGGRVRSWPVPDAAGPGSTNAESTETGSARAGAPQADETAPPRTMGRGFYAFFRQYYNLRKLLDRLPVDAPGLVPVPDYPLVAANGLEDSFARIPRNPPWNFLGFVLASPSFRLRDLPGVNIGAALSLLDVDFPQTFRDHDGADAASFLDVLGFPERARHLALEVFARSFFAAPEEFSAGEMVGMFHTYFLGSAEGLLFDTAADDFDTALWAPLGRALERLGVRRRRAAVTALDFGEDSVRATFAPVPEGAPAGALGQENVGQESAGQESAGQASAAPEDAMDGDAREDHLYDAVVLATDPATTRRLARDCTGIEDPAWRASLDRLRTAPPFAVWRLWLDTPVNPERPAFLGTAGFGGLDNLSVLERFEAGAAAWARSTGGSVVELHAYSLGAEIAGHGIPGSGTADPDKAEPDAAQAALRRSLREQMERIWPETADARILHEEWLVEQDCFLADPGPWDERPGVRTPDPRLVLAGDGLRCELPVALMERAATTGWQAANQLLEDWDVAGHDLMSPPRTGPAWARIARRLLRRLPDRGTR